MNIVQLVENLEVGGLERLTVDLAVTHRSAGHQSSIYCIFEAGALAAEAEASGIPVVAFRNKPGLSPGTIVRIASRLRRDRTHVLHVHNPGIHIYGAPAARLAGIRAVVNTRHGTANSLGRPYQERHFRCMMPLTGKVVAVSEETRQFLVKSGISPEKTCVILNGLPLEKFLGRPAAPGSVLPRVRFGTVGRLVPVKAHRTLLEAFGLLLPRLPDAELRIVGGGPLLTDLKAQVDTLGLAGRAHLLGPRSDIPAILAGLDVFVSSSTREGMPLAVFEAMAAGLPIVSTRVGGVPEIAAEGEVAWFCPPGDAPALAEAMYRAATSGRLHTMGRAAREVALNRLGIERMQRSYQALFEDLLGRS